MHLPKAEQRSNVLGVAEPAAGRPSSCDPGLIPHHPHCSPEAALASTNEVREEAVRLRPSRCTGQEGSLPPLQNPHDWMIDLFELLQILRPLTQKRAATA